MTETPREENKLFPSRVENIEGTGDLIQEFKSYPDMCRRLNLEIKTGRAKQNQMKELGKRFHLEVKGQKIKIEEIRDGEELKEIERREGEDRLERDCEMGEAGEGLRGWEKRCGWEENPQRRKPKWVFLSSGD